jgi:DNA (cytosine-5)-methyltransferase 1
MNIVSGDLLREQRTLIKLSQAKLAEISQVPQHLISAFELGKITLTDDFLEKINRVLNSKNKIDKVVKRTKRYQDHKYVTTPRLPDRVNRAIKTATNDAYVSELKSLYKKHKDSQPRKLNALSLFSGCGGFSLGVSAAGFHVKGFVELDQNLRREYKDNFPSSLEIGSDISKISDASIQEALQQIGPIDLIVGGPPCQGFSLSGKRDVNDPRNSLFRDYLRFVDVFKPKIAILENVKLLTSMKNDTGGYVRDDISSEFKKHGYLIEFFNVNAHEYGVPQSRERVIFVAVRDDLGITPSIPAPMYTQSAVSETLRECRTFGDATSDLEYLESGDSSLVDSLHEAVKHPAHVIKWLWNVPEGFSAHDNDDPSLRPPSGYNTTYKRQVWNEPASTVQTTFGMISGCRNVHPVATRSLTIREAARIQSFPDEYKFSGSLGTIRTGIGNAVPPLLAYQLGKFVAELLNRR